MREIKFRGKRISDDKWVYGYYCKASDRHLIIMDNAKLINPNGGLVMDISPNYYINGYAEVDPKTVGEYTGRKNDDGFEIYEGHILEDDCGNVGVVEFRELPLDKAGDCVCTYQAFYVKTISQNASYECCDIGTWMKIIGDKSDKPELSESDK